MGDPSDGKDLPSIIKEYVQIEGKKLLEDTIGKDAVEIAESIVRDEVALDTLASKLAPYVINKVKEELYRDLHRELYSDVTNKLKKELYTGINPKKR